MPREGYKVITIKKEVFEMAKELVELGVANSLSDAVEKAVLEKLEKSEKA